MPDELETQVWQSRAVAKYFISSRGVDYYQVPSCLPFGSTYPNLPMSNLDPECVFVLPTLLSTRLRLIFLVRKWIGLCQLWFIDVSCQLWSIYFCQIHPRKHPDNNVHRFKLTPFVNVLLYSGKVKWNHICGLIQLTSIFKRHVGVLATRSYYDNLYLN